MHIKQGGELTTKPWNPKTNKGGKLQIECFSLIMDKGALINCNGLGYWGGQSTGQRGLCYVDNRPIQSCWNNLGGGGGGGGGRASYSERYFTHKHHNHGEAEVSVRSRILESPGWGGGGG